MICEVFPCLHMGTMKRNMITIVLNVCHTGLSQLVVCASLLCWLLIHGNWWQQPSYQLSQGHILWQCFGGWSIDIGCRYLWPSGNWNWSYACHLLPSGLASATCYGREDTCNEPFTWTIYLFLHSHCHHPPWWQRQLAYTWWLALQATCYLPYPTQDHYPAPQYIGLQLYFP